MISLSAIALFALFAVGAAALGIAALALWPSGAQRASDLLEAAAGGALLVMGLGFLAIEAAGLSPAAPVLIVIGVGLGAALQWGAARAAGPGAGALTLLAGLGLHSLLDGAAFTIALSADPAFGLGSALGLVTHDAPKALFAFVLLRRAGQGPVMAGGGAMVLAAGLSALGAFGAVPAVGGLTLESLGALIALAAGLLAWSGAACLATAFKRPSAARAAAAAAGAGLVLLVGWAGHAWDQAGADDPRTAAAPPAAEDRG
jgi:hypothetical protein